MRTCLPNEGSVATRMSLDLQLPIRSLHKRCSSSVSSWCHSPVVRTTTILSNLVLISSISSNSQRYLAPLVFSSAYDVIVSGLNKSD